MCTFRGGDDVFVDGEMVLPEEDGIRRASYMAVAYSGQTIGVLS